MNRSLRKRVLVVACLCFDRLIVVRNKRESPPLINRLRCVVQLDQLRLRPLADIHNILCRGDTSKEVLLPCER